MNPSLRDRPSAIKPRYSSGPATFFLCLLLALWSSVTAKAQVADLTRLYEASNLFNPQGLTQGSDGAYYGTTSSGGDFNQGAIFKMTATGEVIVLHRFQGTDGRMPLAAPVQGRDGNLYGTTAYGGSFDSGTLYKLSPSGILTSLHSFDYTEGSYPYATLVQGADGSFYGTTLDGGSGGRGTIFKVTSQGQFTLLHSFSGEDGANPIASLVQGSDSLFYGTTRYGGLADRGTVFKMSASGAFTNLHSFTFTEGDSPFGTLVFGPNGVLYGTTYSGGNFGNGTIFRISTAGAFEQLHSFDQGEEGNSPRAGLTLGANGIFYGTTASGGLEGSGTVFKITAVGTFSVLHQFLASEFEGQSSSSTLVLGRDGLFHGACVFGGNADRGTLFQISPTGSYDTTHTFQDRAEVELPSALVRGNDGAFYGTSDGAGVNFLGAVFKITTDGDLSILHSFDGTDGYYPSSALVLGNDGAFYGTARFGGDFGDGTVYRIAADGNLTTLHSFSFYEDGANPFAALVQAGDGFIGSTGSGGSDVGGTIFKITKNGVFTLLHSFTGNDGNFPSALVAGGDGFFYGTTPNGGNSYDGSVFKISEAGGFTTLASFEYSFGSAPGPLVQGGDGDFYGTTRYGGDLGSGTFFKVTAAGQLTTLLTFDGSNGRGSNAALIRASDGEFYGTSQTSGDFNVGAVFKLTESGVYSVVAGFPPGDADATGEALVQDRDGAFYGSVSGNNSSRGSIFKLVVTPMPLPTYSLSLNGNLAFGKVAEGATEVKTLTIANTGNSPVNILGITYPPGFSGTWQDFIPAGLEQDVAVAFSPTAVANFGGKLKVYSDTAASTPGYPLSGKGITAIRNMTLSGDLAFGSIPAGSVAQKSFTITNNGNSPLTVSSITYPVGFSGNWTGSVAVGSSQHVLMSFAPTQIKSYGGAVTVNSNATAGANTLPASGQGIAATRIVKLSGSVVFGDVAVGTMAERELTIRNTGNSPLEVQYLTLPEGFYSYYTGIIPPGGSAKALIYFSPFEEKEYRGLLKVQSDASSGTNATALSGRGVASTPIISLTGNLDFGNVATGSSAQRAMTIRNTGNAPVYVYNVALPDGFSSTYSVGTIAPNGSSQVLIQFSPFQAVSYGGLVSVESDVAAISTLPISGQGIGATRNIALSGDLAFGDVTVGATAQRFMTISNSGNSTLNVSGITFPADFSGDWSGAIPAGRSQKVPVYFSPVRKRTSSGVVTVNGNSTSGVNTTPVSGTGK